jgi:DNA-binding XRE family transcriptional regulator
MQSVTNEEREMLGRVGKNIEDIRLASMGDRSRAELARRANITTQTLTNIEKACDTSADKRVANPTTVVVHRIAMALGVGMSDLYNGMDSATLAEIREAREAAEAPEDDAGEAAEAPEDDAGEAAEAPEDDAGEAAEAPEDDAGEAAEAPEDDAGESFDAWESEGDDE